MTTKKLASDLVQERRMRPIYELLDSGSNKKALSDIDRLLKKNPDYHHAKVVKALTLIRMRRVEEAVGILNEIIEMAEQKGLDVGDTTQILLTCYKELNQHQMICSILEHLCASRLSEDLLSQYFMSLVRVHEFRKMHQTAMNLYKTFHKPAYFSWAIASLVLHHEHFIGPLDEQDTLSFQLAERMIDKFLIDQTTKNPEFKDQWNLLDLYIRLMIRQSTNWDKMLGILKMKGNPQQQLSSWSWDSFHENYCFVMEHAGNGTELLKYLQDLFMEYKEYSLLKQIVDIFGKNESFWEIAVEFMDNLRNKHGSQVVALGNLYFVSKYKKRYPENQRKEKIEEDLLMAIQFGLDKTNFYPDVVQYFKLVDHARQCELLGIMAPRTSVSEESKPLDFKKSQVEIIKDINYELARRDVMGQVFNLHQRIEQANFCFGKYLRWMQAIEKRGELSDGPANNSLTSQNDEVDYLDQYVIIAASILLSEHCKLGRRASPETSLEKLFGQLVVADSIARNPKSQKSCLETENLIISAICLMEYCLRRTPQNSTVRLLLANAYARLGAATEMLKVMQEINIKHIQLDSLGYLFYPIVTTSGTYSDAIMMLRQADEMYSTFENEIMEFTIAAYEHCSFKQVSDFNFFREKLIQSTHCGIVIVEKRLLELWACTDSMEMLKNTADHFHLQLNFEEMAKNFCFDNRDLTVMHNLFDDEIDWTAFKESTAKLDARWFHTRLCFFRIISKLVIISMNNESPEVFTFGDFVDLKNLGKDLDDLIRSWDDLMGCGETLEYPFYGVYPPRYSRFFDLSIPDCLLKQVNCAIKIMMENHPASAVKHLKMYQDCMSQDAHNLLKILEKNYEIFQDNLTFKQIESCIHDFHFAIEFFAFSKVFLSVVASTTRLAQFQKTSVKSKGKKEKAEQERKVAVIIKDILDGYQKLHKLLCEFINFLKNRPLPTWSRSKSTDAGSSNGHVGTNFLLEAFPTTFNDVQKNIRGSHLEQLLAMAGSVELMMKFIRNI